MAFSVQDIISQHIFQDVELVAGEKGRKNEIRWFNIMEIMDSPETVSPNELLFTTGYGFQDAELYRELIPQLAQRGVSGMVVQTGYYIDSVPTYILNQANKAGFPVLTIPKHITFSELLHTMIRVLAPECQQGWDDNSMRQAFIFLNQSLKSKARELFPDCGSKSGAQPPEQRIQVVLMESANYIYADEGKRREYISQIRSYIQSHSRICCVQELPHFKYIFLVANSVQNCRSMLCDLSIKCTLLSERFGVDYYMGAETVHSLEDSGIALEHAVESIVTLRSIRARRGVCAYDNINFIKMVGRMHQTDYSAVLDNQPLQILLNYDRAHETNYVHTMRVYLANNCNVTQTAKQLFIHRHTLLKRLDKISIIGNVDLEDYNTRVCMSVNLMFHDFFVY